MSDSAGRSDEERVRRVGENEALVRTVNEKLEDLNEAFSTFSNTFAIVCECGDPTCLEQIHLRRDDYESLRSDPTRFAVVPGHEVLETEEVVEHRDGYDVVRKHEGLAANLARATEP